MVRKYNKAKISIRFKEYSKGIERENIEKRTAGSIVVTTDQADEAVLPIPEPTPALLMVWGYIKEANRDAVGLKKRRLYLSEGKISSRINSYTGFKSYYSRVFSIEGGLASVKTMNTLLSQVWATYEHKSTWDHYAHQYLRYSRNLTFVEWLFIVPKKSTHCGSPPFLQKTVPALQDPFTNLEQSEPELSDSDATASDSMESPASVCSEFADDSKLSLFSYNECQFDIEFDQVLQTGLNMSYVLSKSDEVVVNQHYNLIV